MRIAVNGLAAKWGGALTYLVNILPEFMSLSRSDQFILYASRESAGILESRLGPLCNRLLLRVIPATGKTSTRVLWELFALDQAMRRDGIDVLYASVPTAVARCSVPVVTAIRNMAPYCSHLWHQVTFRERVRYLYLRALTARALRLSATVILVSASTQSLLQRYHRLSSNKIRVIYHGKNPSFRPLNAEDAVRLVKQRFRLTEPFILYVSTMWPYKQHVELVQAFGLLRARHNRNEHLIIAGKPQEPNYSKLIAAIRAQGLEQYVHFLGYVPYDWLPALYNACKIFAYPSTCEACSNVVIEALACGLPIALSDIPVLRELAQDAAVYFDPFDVESIAHGLLKLLSDDEMQAEFRERALARSRLFSWKHTARETLALLRRAVEH